MSSSFNPKGRERFAPKMKAAGYVELPEFEGHESNWNYCCLSCVYFTTDDSTITGYRCKEWGFPDEKFGCCDSYKSQSMAKNV
jgi:hypothetical protein